MDYSRYYNIINTAHDKIIELRKERAGLEEFSSEVRRGSSEFASQLAHKRAAARKAQSVGNSHLALRFGNQFLQHIGTPFQSRMEDNFSSIQRDAQRAINDVDREIEQQRNLIQSTERELQQQQELERKRQEAAHTAASSSTGGKA